MQDHCLDLINPFDQIVIKIVSSLIIWKTNINLFHEILDDISISLNECLNLKMYKIETMMIF